jgi:hypothetical protein
MSYKRIFFIVIGGFVALLLMNTPLNKRMKNLVV